MRYMLDTNICSYVLRSRPASVKERFDEAGPDALGISTVVLAELLYGAARHPAARSSAGRSGTSSPGWTSCRGTRRRRSTTGTCAPGSSDTAGRSAPWTS